MPGPLRHFLSSQWLLSDGSGLVIKHNLTSNMTPCVCWFKILIDKDPTFVYDNRI